MSTPARSGQRAQLRLAVLAGLAQATAELGVARVDDELLSGLRVLDHDHAAVGELVLARVEQADRDDLVASSDWTRIETPAWAIERADAIAHEIVTGIAASGVRVVGDLDALQGVAGVPAPATAADAGPGDDRVPSEIAAELALGVLLAGGAAPEVARSVGASGPASTGKADGRRAAARDPKTGRRSHDLTGVPTRVLARALVRRVRAAAARRVRPPKGKAR